MEEGKRCRNVPAISIADITPTQEIKLNMEEVTCKIIIDLKYEKELYFICK